MDLWGLGALGVWAVFCSVLRDAAVQDQPMLDTEKLPEGTRIVKVGPRHLAANPWDADDPIVESDMS